jgi:hypothetical protein
LNNAGNTVVQLVADSETSAILIGVGRSQWNQLRDTRGTLLWSGGDDYTADAGTTGRVAVGGSATGTLEQAGDRDWFAVDLDGGRSYTFTMSGASSGGGTLSDPYLSL